MSTRERILPTVKKLIYWSPTILGLILGIYFSGLGIFINFGSSDLCCQQAEYPIMYLVLCLGVWLPFLMLQFAVYILSTVINWHFQRSEN